MHGTIAVHGCSIDAGDLLVRARPIDYSPAPGHPPTRGGARSFIVHAVPSGAPDARDGDFAFAFEGLVTGVPYRIGVKVVGRSQHRCPRLAWDVDRDPLVVGGDAPLVFDAYAVPSELEIRGAAQGRHREAWVGADAVDFTDPSSATRQLRWRTSVPGATGGELQISLVPFPRLGDRAGPCSEDGSAIVKRVPFAVVPGKWAMPDPIDFHALVYPNRTDDGGGIASPASDALIDPDLAGIDPATRTKLELGMPLYLRVVPTNADGPICDPDTAGVPAGVLVARVVKALLQAPPAETPRLEVAKVVYSKPVIGKRPAVGETCYRATQKHVIPSELFFFGWSSWEMLASSVVKYDNSQPKYKWFVPEGAQFCVCNNCSDDDGWLESFAEGFGAVITGLVDAVAKLVNSASELWEDVQDAAVAAVADGITALPLGIDCDATCQKALETGLEVALATMGVPPSLPNFDQLVDQGFDYVAAQAMSEVGVPSAISDYVSGELSDAGQKFMKKAVANMKTAPYSIPKLPNWLVPDLRFQRAVLTLDMYGPGVAESQAFSTRPGMILNNDPIYGGAFLRLPRKIPAKASGTPLTFPVVLEPNLIGLPSAPAHYDAYNTARVDKNNWVKQRYTNGCYHLWLTGLTPDPADIFKLFSATFRAEDASIACGP